MYRQILHCYKHWSFVINFEKRKCESSNFVFIFFKIVLAILYPLYFHVNFKNRLSISAKEKTAVTVMGIVFNLYINFESILIITILNPISEWMEYLFII